MIQLECIDIRFKHLQNDVFLRMFRDALVFPFENANIYDKQ